MAQTVAKQNQYYQRLLFVFKHAAAFLPLIMIPFGLIVRAQFVDSRFYSGDMAWVGISIGYSAVSIMYFYAIRRWPEDNKVLLIFTLAFHAMTLAFILFVSGFLSAFLAMWIILLIGTDINFGTRGFFLSFAGLCVSGLLSILLHPVMSAGEQIEVLQGAIVVGAIGYVIARIRAITDRERIALAKTRQQEIYQRERLLALVNSMGDAVVATDEQGAIKVYNATMLSLLDTNMNFVGKSIDDVLKLKDRQGSEVSIIAQAQQTKGVFSRTDLSHTFNDGEVLKLYINVAPIRPSYQSHAERGYILILRDITKEKTLEEERDEFISVVSHELRTPIAIAEGNLSNIKILQERGAAPEVMTRAVESSHEQILYLAKLINDLGTLSRAERGVGADIEVIDFVDLLHDLYTTYLPQAQAKKLKLDLNVAAPLPQIKTSRLYLQEVLQNLITNAVKYTKEGGITITAKQTPKGVQVAIADTGIGISKADQKHMFEKFYRSEDYRTRESSGTGLGLYLCKKLAEKLGINISFTSRLNHGSTFTLVLPPKLYADTKKDGAH